MKPKSGYEFIIYILICVDIIVTVTLLFSKSSPKFISFSFSPAYTDVGNPKIDMFFVPDGRRDELLVSHMNFFHLENKDYNNPFPIEIVINNAHYRLYDLSKIDATFNRLYDTNNRTPLYVIKSNYEPFSTQSFTSIFELEKYIASSEIQSNLIGEDISIKPTNLNNEAYWMHDIYFMGETLYLQEKQTLDNCKVSFPNPINGTLNKWDGFFPFETTYFSIFQECSQDENSIQKTISIGSSNNSPIIIFGIDFIYNFSSGSNFETDNYRPLLLVLHNQTDNFTYSSKNGTFYLSAFSFENNWVPFSHFISDDIRVTITDIGGELVYGKNTKTIPNFSSLSFHPSIIQNGLINVNNPGDLSDRNLYRGETDKITLNGDPLIEVSENQNKSLAIQTLNVFVVILITILIAIKEKKIH